MDQTPESPNELERVGEVEEKYRGCGAYRSTNSCSSDRRYSCLESFVEAGHARGRSRWLPKSNQ